MRLMNKMCEIIKMKMFGFNEPILSSYTMQSNIDNKGDGHGVWL